METTEHLEDAWRALAPQTAALAKSAAALKKIAVALSAPAGYESLKAVERALAKLDDLEAVPEALLGSAKSAAEPVRTWLAGEWDRRAGRFAAELVEHFEARAVPVTGEAPDLVAGRIGVSIRASQDRVDLSYAGEPVKTGLPMSSDRVFREREAALQRLQKGATSPDALADQLLEAYDELVHRAGAKPGSRIRLPDVHFELFAARQTPQSRTTLTKARLKEYPRAQFAWDLAGLLDMRHFQERDGRTLTLVTAPPSAATSRTASVALVRANGDAEAYAALTVS